MREMKDSGIDWVGAVPSSWEIKRVKNIAKLRNGSDPKTEGTIPVYGSGSSSFKTCGEYKEGPTVLLGRKGATLHIPSYIEGAYWNVDTAFDVVMRDDNSLRFFYYLATCFNYGYYLTDTALPSMTQSDYGDMKVAIPEISEQLAIAAYLDARCTSIDEAVARHRTAIDKLEEYRRAVIARTVAGKANGLSSSRWVWKRFKFIAHVDSNLVEPDGYGNWLHVSPDAIGKGNGRLLYRRTVLEDGVISGNHLFHKGAILYSKVRPRLNKVVIAPDDGLCSADMYPISTGQVTEWLRYYMLSDQFVEQAGLVSDIRIKMPKINQQELGDLKILVPPSEEQLDIVAYLDYQCAAVDDAIDRQHRIIDKLEEYRRSLIHAAVTGRIDCTKETL